MDLDDSPSAFLEVSHDRFKPIRPRSNPMTQGCNGPRRWRQIQKPGIAAGRAILSLGRSPNCATRSIASARRHPGHCRRLLERARDGDVATAKLLLAYTIGKPRSPRTRTAWMPTNGRLSATAQMPVESAAFIRAGFRVITWS